MRTEVDLLSLPSLPNHQISFPCETPLFVKDLELNRTFALPHYAGQNFYERGSCKVGSRLGSVMISSSACLGSDRLCNELSTDHDRKMALEMWPMSFRLIPKMHGAPKTSGVEETAEYSLVCIGSPDCRLDSSFK